MKYKVIEREKLSGADFAAIIQFGSCTDAMAAAKAINESSETNTPGSASEGNTGAFRVGKCVVFNAYHQACYDKFIKIIGSLDCSVESLADNLWDGMACPEGFVGDDMDAAIAYLSAMFPEAKATIESPDSFYFDYDGVEYLITLKYDDADKNNQLRGWIIIASNYDDTIEPVTIDRHTPDVKGTLEKFFKKAKPAGDSPDSPDSLAEPSLMDRLDRLDAAVKTLNAEIRKIKKNIKK